MSTKDTLSLLSSPRTELFKGLWLDELAACIPSFRETKFKKGQALFVRGERATGLYLVAEGRVRLAIATEDGRELSFRHATAGELLGEIAALDGGTRIGRRDGADRRHGLPARQGRLSQALARTAGAVRAADLVPVRPAARHQRTA